MRLPITRAHIAGFLLVAATSPPASALPHRASAAESSASTSARRRVDLDAVFRREQTALLAHLATIQTSIYGKPNGTLFFGPAEEVILRKLETVNLPAVAKLKVIQYLKGYIDAKYYYRSWNQRWSINKEVKGWKVDNARDDFGSNDFRIQFEEDGWAVASRQGRTGKTKNGRRERNNFIETVTILGLDGKTKPLVRIERHQKSYMHLREIPVRASFWEATVAGTAGSPEGDRYLVRSAAGRVVDGWAAFPNKLDEATRQLRATILDREGRPVERPTWNQSFQHTWPGIPSFIPRYFFGGDPY